MLDSKISEYVFFPLSHIFRQIHAFSDLIVENCVKCLAVLIGSGWETHMTQELARQLLSLLVVIVDGKPGAKEKREVPEELQIEVFSTLSVLFSSIRRSLRDSPVLSGAEFMPTTGHAISLLLEAIEDATYSEVQVRAADALREAFQASRDQEAFEAFLPGSVSALVKILASPAKRKSAVLATCVQVLSSLLTLAVGDMRVQRLQLEAQREDGTQTGHGDASGSKTKSLQSWLEATTGQVKLALLPVMKLNTHDNSTVRRGIYQLCLALLDECHETLAKCAPILVETSMVLSGEFEAQRDVLRDTSLQDLAGIHPELGDMAKTAVYSWMTSLPRQAQTKDDRTRQKAFSNLAGGLRLLQELHVESSTLDDAIASSMQSSIVALLGFTSPPNQSTATQIQLLTDNHSEMETRVSDQGPYNVALVHKGTTSTLNSALNDLLVEITRLRQFDNVSQLLLVSLRNSVSSAQIASFWLSFELLKSSGNATAEQNALFDFGNDRNGDLVLGELYAFSLETLASFTDAEPNESRLSMIAMEVVAYAAEQAGADFRPELIDTLFHIATFLGSDDTQLRQQAIHTLNRLAKFCEYENVSELFVANADYVVNSVALRLNSLDISPSSIAVLTMMVRLSGPKLVPFLDDVVESIFAALENFHGYTSFVESLFSVLNEIVTQAAKTDRSLLTNANEGVQSHHKKRPQRPGLTQVMEHLEKQAAHKHEDAEEIIGQRPDGAFQRYVDDQESTENDDEANGGKDVEKPANPPTYKLLERIALLTQHYLTSPTPQLRRSLLDVLSTAAPVLGSNEDSFLPLVNAIWPVVIDRLYDEERYVAIEACRALASLCGAAGDFLTSRMKTAWEDGLGAWCRRCKAEAVQQRKRGMLPPVSQVGGEIVLPFHGPQRSEKAAARTAARSDGPSSLGQHASQSKLWDAIIGLLEAIVTNVRVEDEMFDEILVLLEDVLEEKQSVREALEVVNADAVWLARLQRGTVDAGPTPRIDDLQFADIRSLVMTNT